MSYDEPGAVVEQYFEAMRKGPAGLDALCALFAQDAVYIEPFSGTRREHQGIEAIRTVLTTSMSQRPPGLTLAVARKSMVMPCSACSCSARVARFARGNLPSSLCSSCSAWRRRWSVSSSSVGSAISTFALPHFLRASPGQSIDGRSSSQRSREHLARLVLCSWMERCEVSKGSSRLTVKYPGADL